MYWRCISIRSHTAAALHPMSCLHHLGQSPRPILCYTHHIPHPLSVPLGANLQGRPRDCLGTVEDKLRLGDLAACTRNVLDVGTAAAVGAKCSIAEGLGIGTPHILRKSILIEEGEVARQHRLAAVGYVDTPKECQRRRCKGASASMRAAKDALCKAGPCSVTWGREAQTDSCDRCACRGAPSRFAPGRRTRR